jgi:predicted nucleic acid-binding Zn ribbon protein
MAPTKPGAAGVGGGATGDGARRAASLIAAGLLVALSAKVAAELLRALKAEEESKARRRESMRDVAEGWHFRQWEREHQS